MTRRLTMAVLVTALFSVTLLLSWAEARPSHKKHKKGVETVPPPAQVENVPVKCVPCVPTPARRPASAPANDSSAHEKAICQRLNKSVSLNFKETPLSQVISDLRTLSGINLIPDKQALEAALVSVDHPLTLDVENISLKSALNLLLKQVQLTYVIQDEVLVITTAENAQGKLRQITYPVADLVVPVPDYKVSPVVGLQKQLELHDSTRQGCVARTPLRKGTEPSYQGCTKTAAVQTIESHLIELITKTVAPQSWSSVGGRGEAQYFPLGMALVINQTTEVHEEVQALLAALRKLQDLEVAVEVKLVQVSDEFLDKVRTEMGIRPRTVAAPEPLTLGDDQVARLLELAQDDRRINIMQAPKMTVFNGQNVALQIIDEQAFVTDFEVIREGDQAVVRPKTEKISSGLKMSVQPIVSADRASVRLAFNLQWTTVDPQVPLVPVTTHLTRIHEDGEEQEIPVPQFVQQPRVSTRVVEHKLSIPAGRTAILDAGKMQATTVADQLPISDILYWMPYGRWLSLAHGLYQSMNVKQESQNLLILITPRIIVVEQEEAVGCGPARP